MLKKILIGVGVLVLAFVLFSVYTLFIATPASPPDATKFTDQGFEIVVEYSRPYKKGRLIFGDEADEALQPFGKYWRLGANAATEISFNKNVLFGGQQVEAGQYRMYAVPGPDSFKVTLNSELDVFFGVAEADPSLDILSVNAPVTMQNDVTEQFTINISGTAADAKIDFIWDNFLFSVPVAVQ